MPRKVLWWALRSVGIEEWAVCVINSMYAGVTSISQFRVNSHLCQVFSVDVGIHQGSVLSSLLFIIVLEALSGELRTSILWELLYADDLAVIARLNEKLKTWKNKIESKGLQST